MTKKERTPAKIAVRCKNCKKILAFKLGATTGCLQLKCPACKTELKVDLSLRRAKFPIQNRRATYPAIIGLTNQIVH